ncbi:MAG: 50S ribosomal protein L4 [Gemmatimonadetes bacterium]|nr:50S ribosomal protein L4 [Gemmatimonadota bacterium]
MAETNQTPQASAYTSLGTARTEKVALPEATFDGVINVPVMHKAVTAFLANQRQGNASTKIRKYVTGGNQKPWKQKGTGRARQGSTRAPHWVGGGTVFGPTPRAYDQYVPRQVRAVRLGVDDKKVLILTDGVKPNVFLSGRNIQSVHVMPYSDASTYHILWSDVVLVEAGALGQSLEPIQETATAPVKRARSAADVARGERKVAKRAAKSAAKKSTAKKSAAKKDTVKKSAPKSAKKSAAKKSTKKKEK